MDYQVLARKWRPKNFTEVAGQEHVLRALTNSLTQQRLHHAYLFSGTRGVGKTSIARILAKCFNCETGITPTPCGKCDTCVEIDTGRSIDIIEVDAASRTKVEDTRDLLDNVQYLPAKNRFKIYIIDEVHMLSGHSFNALLKTLEEPPAHVKFLLATTDPQKLPVTVLSRCLQFNLKALSPELLQKQLKYILSQEKIPAEDQALYQLALNANGSVRDALSLLDQAISFGHNQVTTADVKTMLSSIDTGKVLELLEALVANNADLMLAIIAELAELAVDFVGTINELLEILHQVTIAQLAPNSQISSWQYPEQIKKLAVQLNPEEVQLYYQIGLIGKRDLFLAPSLKSGFEMIMLRMLAFRPNTTTNAGSSVSQIKSEDRRGMTGENRGMVDANKPATSVKQPIINPDTANTATTEVNTNILHNLEVTAPTQALLKHCIVTKVTDNEVELLLDSSQAAFMNKKHEERISASLSKFYGSPMIVRITLGTTGMDTPANTKKQEDAQKQHQALQSIEKDHRIKELMSKFDAKIIPDSVNSAES